MRACLFSELLFRQQLAETENENMMLRQQVETLSKDLNGREYQVKLLEGQVGVKERKGDVSERKIHNLEKKVKALEREVDEKNQIISQAHVDKERMKQRHAEHLRTHMERVKREFEQQMAEKEARLNREKCIDAEKIHRVHEILCCHPTDWASVESNLPRTPISPPPSNTATGSSSLPPKDAHSTPVPSQRSPDKGRSKGATQVKQRHSDYDLVRAMQSPRNEVFSTYGESTQQTEFPPVANPRHRRSLSTGAEKWIDHRPTNTLDLGTVFQPKFKNKTSLTNLRGIGASELRDASMYALTHHTADANGDVETHVYKGEVIPSSGGGAQVIFNDVETLRQESPTGR